MRLIVVFIFIVSNSYAQSTFPELWSGIYSGTMKIGNTDRPTIMVDVEFELLELINDSAWTHKMTFRSDNYGDIVKDYVIRAQAKGDTVNYFLDEQNGIGMETTLLNDCFYGTYTVSGTMYVSTLRRLDDQTLLWDLFAAEESSKKRSELIRLEGEETEIEVFSLKPSLNQTVFLKRIR